MQLFKYLANMEVTNNASCRCFDGKYQSISVVVHLNAGRNIF